MSVTVKRVKSLLRAARKSRVLVVGDVMLDQFMWGSVKRISRAIGMRHDCRRTCATRTRVF